MESRLPWWRVLLLLGCGDLQLLTREGFGTGYFCLLVALFFLRATLLLPFPGFSSYGQFQDWISLLFIVHLVVRRRMIGQMLLAGRDTYDAGSPGRWWLVLRERSPLFLLVLEPALAVYLTWLMAEQASRVNLWTPPSYGIFWWRNSHAPSIFELPLFLQSYLLFGQELLDQSNPRLVAGLLLLTFPLCTLLNGVAEYRAQYQASTASPLPEGNAPQLTFPEVRS